MGIGGQRPRRRYLQALGTAAVAALAGCGDNDSDSKESSADDTSPPTNTTNSTETENNTTDSEWDLDPIEHDKTVAAWYYAWYGGPVRNPFTEYSPSTPKIGQYDSQDKAIINQHIKWAREHGINTFITRWGGPGAYDDDTLLNYFFEAELGSEIDIMLEPSVTALTPGDTKAPKDFDKEENRLALVEAFEYLDSEYFGRSSYARIDGRPVVEFFSVTGQSSGDFSGALADAKAVVSDEPFVIGDAAHLLDPSIDGAARNPRIKYGDLLSELDALTTYNLYEPRELADREFPEYVDYLRRLGIFRRLGADAFDIPFIPDVMPGFDDSKLPDRPEQPALEATPERFKQLIDSQSDLIDPNLNTIFVTSFNEWYEDTSVEPREEYDTAFLETIEDHLIRNGTDLLEPTGIFDQLQFRFNQTIRPDNSNRDLAWYVSDLTLHSADGEELVSYDIGVPDSEPYLVEGAYNTEEIRDDSPSTRRWFGGPFKRTTAYVQSHSSKPASATVSGAPIREDAIEVTVAFNGEVTDAIALGPREWRTHEISLTN